MYKVFNRGTGRYEVADYENQKYAATFDKYHEALAFCEYKNSGAVYHFTAEQLQKMLAETISSFIEWRDTHGKDEASAAQCAASEVIEGTNADRELYLSGDDKLKFQLLFFSGVLIKKNYSCSLKTRVATPTNHRVDANIP